MSSTRRVCVCVCVCKISLFKRRISQASKFASNYTIYEHRPKPKTVVELIRNVAVSLGQSASATDQQGCEGISKVAEGLRAAWINSLNIVSDCDIVSVNL